MGRPRAMLRSWKRLLSLKRGFDPPWPTRKASAEMSVTTTPKTCEPAVDFPVFGDGDGQPRCMWDEDVCSDMVWNAAS